MGTNYYLESKPCEHCGRSEEPRHIGKSSAGWCFSLRVYPDEEIHDLNDWKEFFKGTEPIIKDEYEQEITVDKMINIITNRSHPRGLTRHTVDGCHCIGYGEGTYDYMVGEFF